MRLKRLSIKGFKSFADETDIHFNEDLIGIVGPNGSGKSNVVDAVRWVLGEGKKSELRLADMSDVIFSGTEARKEGRVARVSLTFDNAKNILPTDFSEVTITRILHRDGNSEYRLNNVSCRKKDITNLFVDSGIGSNSYAIISLNMVEDILHDSGGSRRQMIEQAAGISKYKIRKKETLSKLRSTDEDLDRVKDLLFEIEKNMASFERQARRTERYNTLKLDYKELSIKVSHIEVKGLSVALSQLQEQLAQEKVNHTEITADLHQQEAALQQLKTNILASEKSLNEDQQRYNELIERLGKVENNKNLTVQQRDSAWDRIEVLSNSRDQLQQSADASQHKIETGAKVVADLGEQLTLAKRQIEESQATYQQASDRYTHLRQREKDIKTEIQSRQRLQETLGREVEAERTKKVMLEADIESLASRIDEIQKNVLSEEGVLAERANAVTTASEKVEQAQKAAEQLQLELTNLNEALNGLTVQRNKVQVEHNALEQRIKFLSNIIESNEGLPESVKWIIQESKKEVHVFSDLIEITDDRYTKIVELYLEPYFHHVLSVTKSDAIKVYEKIRGAQKGKIKLFVLDEIEEQSLLHTSHSSLIPLSSVIRVDPKWRRVIDLICKDVFIALQSYSEIKGEITPELTVLFPEEFLVVSQGMVYGGSNTLFEGVQLGRKKILEGLESKKAQVQEQLDDILLQMVDQRKRIEDLHEQIKKDKVLLHSVRQEESVAKQQIFQAESTVRNRSENLLQLKAESDHKKSALEQVVATLSEKEERWTQVKQIDTEELTNDELGQQVEEAHLDFIEKGQIRETAQRHLFEIQSQFDSAQKDQGYYENMVVSIQQRLDEAKREEATLRQTISDNEKILSQNQEELRGLYSQKKELQTKLNTYEDTYYKEKGKIFESEKAISALRSRITAKDQLISTLSERQTNLSFEIKGIHERNSIEFGIEIDTKAFPEEYESEDLPTLKEKRRKLNDRIRNYGDINPMAITAYNEIKERHERISKERDDILDAKVALEQTISEIEKTASDRFNKALDDIRVNFRHVFQGLFSADDDCDIVLLNAEDPLQANIEIIAKPKGKRPKSISQLSGGEKTLTAASFLFALYLLKPAPFCIFDEVDAPLDDVNVQKFNKLIRKFSGSSQFIVITHNKLTMAEVDILYGVYLKERGVSGVSAVDFRNYEAAELLTAAE